jgi:hypothetical protein
MITPSCRLRATGSVCRYGESNWFSRISRFTRPLEVRIPYVARTSPDLALAFACEYVSSRTA